MGATSKSLSENPRGNIGGESASRFAPVVSTTKLSGSSSPYTGKNIPAYGGNNLSADSHKDLPAFSITQHILTEKSQAIMLDFVGNDPGAAKRLARKLGCSIGTAKNYLEGRTTPSGIHDIRAMAVIPGWFDHKAEMAGVEMVVNSQRQAKMAAFLRYASIEAEKIFGGET